MSTSIIGQQQQQQQGQQDDNDNPVEYIIEVPMKARPLEDDSISHLSSNTAGRQDNSNPEYIAVAMVTPMEGAIISHHSTSNTTMDDDNIYYDGDNNNNDNNNNNVGTRTSDVIESSSPTNNVNSFDRLKFNATTSRIRLPSSYDIITRKLKTCSKSRRLVWQLVILLLIVLLIIITSKRIRRSNDNNLNPATQHHQQDDDDDDVVGYQQHGMEITTSKYVVCNRGEYNLTLNEWITMNQKDMNSRNLCDPLFHPSSKQQVEANINKPVQVFIMLGENNMVGEGHVHGLDVEGTLEYTVFKKLRFQHLIDPRYFQWTTTRSDVVRHVAVSGEEFNVRRNEWLGMHDGQHHIGPELQFGYIMGEVLDSPVLLLKSCSNTKSLGVDLLPPGSARFEYDGYMYAGYGDEQFRWLKGTTPKPVTIENWYAGREYDLVVSNIKTVLSNIGTYYPGATEYEIVGFVLWQGESDVRIPALVTRYEQNLVQLIRQLRLDLNEHDAKFTIATIGNDGMDMDGNALTVLKAQLAVGDGKTYPEFASNVRTVDIRPSYRQPFSQPFNDDISRNQNYNYASYGHNAELVMEVSNALGWTMTNLMMNSDN